MDVQAKRAFRMDLAGRDAPIQLRWAIMVMVVMSLLNRGFGVHSVTNIIIDALLILWMLASWWLSRHLRVNPHFTPWLTANVGVSVMVGLTLEYAGTPSPTSPGYTYVLLVMVATGPMCLGYLPTLAAGAVMFLCFAQFRGEWSSTDQRSWLLTSIAAVAVALVLLRVRVRAIDDLAESSEQVHAFALQDHLTGVLNRRGLTERFNALFAMSVRLQQPLFACFIDVDGLKRANDVHGHEVGDAVICAVADAIHRAMRESDVVARWGGDEFVVIGIGAPWPPEAIEGRILDHLRQSGWDPALWTPAVSVGVARADSAERDLEGLLAAADQDMYERRSRRRAD